MVGWSQCVVENKVEAALVPWEAFTSHAFRWEQGLFSPRPSLLGQLAKSFAEGRACLAH